MAVRAVMGATSPGTTQVAPVARSVVALLRAEGVPTQDLDAVFAILSDDEQYPAEEILTSPTPMRIISEQVQRAYSAYLSQQLTVEQDPQ